MTHLFVQRGRRESFLQHVENTAANPVREEAINRILRLIKERDFRDSATFRYFIDNQCDIRAWGTKDNRYGNEAYARVRGALRRESRAEMIFVEGSTVPYISTIVSTNDIYDFELKEKISQTLWGDRDWVNIFFLEDVMRLRNVSRQLVEEMIGKKLVSLGENPVGDNLVVLDDRNCDPERLASLIDTLHQRSAPINDDLSDLLDLSNLL